jgi:hypothetical protein
MTQAFFQLNLINFSIEILVCLKIIYRHPDAGIRIGMSAERSVVTIKTHQFRHLNVHIVQSTVQNMRLELIRQTEVVKTPQCAGQVK